VIFQYCCNNVKYLDKNILSTMPVDYPNGPTIVRGIEDPKFEAEECRNILHKLSRGNVMMKFSMKRKPEQRTFSVSMI